MSKDFYISEKMIIKYLKELVENKLIIKSKLNNNKWNHSNKYEVLFIEEEQEIIDNNHDHYSQVNLTDDADDNLYINNNIINNNSININAQAPSTEFRLIFENFYKSKNWTTDEIKTLIYNVPKERANFWAIIRKFKTIDEFKNFVDKIDVDDFCKKNNFVPSVINSRFSVISKFKGCADYQIKGAYDEL
jgi:hypothetical protein